MRIILDLQACQAASAHRGIGRYSMALALAMARQSGPHELQIVLNSQFGDSVAAIRKAFDGLVPQEQIKLFDLPAPVAEYDLRNSWRMRAAERLREHFLASLQPDVLHVASLFEGLGDDAVASCPPSSGRFDTAVTLYDLIPLLRKDKYLTESHVANWYYRKLQGLKNAELLLAISGHSKREAMGALQLPDERIVNISSAVDSMFRPRQLSDDATAALRGKYGLTRQYIMYTGGVDYRKNIEGLIEAYARLPEALRRQYQLAVVCSMQEVDRHRLQQLGAQHQLAPGDLVLTGFVPDDDLLSLYNLTSLFVFPSLQEGFGLPALEAMQCGVPVIGSNSSSIPEVIGRADALFDPTRVDDIRAKMEQVLTQPAFAADLSAHGLEYAKQFSWDASAKKALSAFEEQHARSSALRTQAQSLQAALPGRRPRLAYVSPLPPERSGIADYSADLLPELARYYEVDVVLDQADLREPWIGANFPQRTAAWFDANAQQYDRILYHFGNSAFHQHMFGLLERHPGVVVLHDFYMSGVTNYMSGASPYPNAYPRALYLSHGYQTMIDHRDLGLEASIYAYPCNRAVLDHADGIIVHSEHSRQLAQHWYGNDSAQDWQMIPLLRMLPGEIDRAAARRQLGIADDVFLVCSFGMLALTKCNDKIVEAWLNSDLGNDKGARLVFVGENDALQFGKDLEARIHGRDNVVITGYASQEMYRLYLAAADAAVQLRTRSRGETSATVLDCLGFRLPTVINAHGSAAEVPDDVAIKLPDQFTEAELADALLRLRHEPALAAELSERAGAYMNAVHHPARIGARYRDTIEAFALHGAQAGHRELLGELADIDCAAQPSQQDLLATAACIAANRARPGPAHLLVDVTALAQQGSRPAHAASQEALLLAMIKQPPAGYRIEPVQFQDGHYRYARRYTLGLIGRPELVLEESGIELKAGDCLLSFTADGGPIAEQSLHNRGLRQLRVLLNGAVPADALARLAALLALAQSGQLDLQEQ